MGKCSVENCENECFEQEDKCILHCEKDDRNGWFTFGLDNKKEWNPEKVKLFWKKVDTKIIGINSVVGDKEAYNEIKDEYNRECFQYYFNKVIFSASIIDDIHYKSFFGLDKDINIYFDKCIFLSITDFELILKAKNVTFNNCRFFEDVEFKQMEFNGLFLFENCKVCKDIKFQNITFKKTTSFIKSKFHQELNFIHSRFDDLALFNEIKVKELLLDNTFFRGESNFLNITANMANRETARIIKNSFEQQNNIIEANRFYALEMEKKSKELKILKNPLEWIVFKLHGISSNHSQNWLLPLFWIMIVSYLYILFSTKFNLIESFLYNLMIKKNLLNEIADLINPFSIMTSKDPITFGLLIFKIIIAYLIYQFIVSVRQNTRRK